MTGRIIPLTPPRQLPPDGRIIFPIRADLPDYGNPGAHLHPPEARGTVRLGTRGGAERVPTPIIEEIPGIAACFPNKTFHVPIRDGGLATGTITVETTQFIQTRYVIHRIRIGTSPVDPANVDVVFKVATDRDATGGFSTTGLPLSQLGTAPNSMQIRRTPFELWPYYNVDFIPSVIKMIVEVGVGPIDIDCIFELLPY